MSFVEQPHHNNHGSGKSVPLKGSDAVPPTVARLREAMEDAGFRIDHDPEYVRRYKLDLIVTRIRGIHAHVNLGAQVTTEADNLKLQEQFLDAARRNVVHKAIYIEIAPSTVNTGAIPVALSGCMAFLFDRRYNHFKSIGLRVFEDCTFHFFDIEENVRRLQRNSQDPGHRVGQELAGNIIAYFTDKGFGFIETEKDQKFFFHIANVLDDDLRVQLPSYHPGEDIPVLFKFGGSDGKKYPKALDVLIDQNEYEEYDEDEEDEDYED